MVTYRVNIEAKGMAENWIEDFKVNSLDDLPLKIVRLMHSIECHNYKVVAIVLAEEESILSNAIIFLN